MRIETGTFILRELEDKDSEELAKIANNKKIFDNLRDAFPHPYSIDDAKKFIDAFKENKPDSIILAIELDGKISGNVSVSIKDDVYRKSAEIGYFLAEEFWGKGIMTDVIKKIVEYTFENYDIVRIYAEPFARNLGSRRVLEKAGFKLEGILKNSIVKNGIIEDSCIYAILKEDPCIGNTIKKEHLKYHHLGIPTKEPKEGEVYLPGHKVYTSGYDTSEFHIEWMRYEDDCPFPESVKTIPHIAFEVSDVYEAIRGKKVIIEPNSPSESVLVAFIEENGVPIEFIQTNIAKP